MVKCAAFLSVWALLAPAAASAGLRTEIHTSGALTLTWHGDVARGCAEAGVCDIAGSVTLAAQPGDSVSESSGNGVLDTLGLGVEDATVRVVRGAPEQPSGVCLDHVGPVELTLGSARPANGRVRVLLRAFDSPFGGPLPANRCAGPLTADLTPALPTTTVRSLRGPDLRLDFSGRRPFAGGPFTGELNSTFVVRARVTRTPPRARRGPLPVPVRPSTRRLVMVRLGYRATPGAEPLTMAFRAAGAPRCESLDACGLSGTTSLTMTKPVDLEIVAAVPLARGRRPTLAAALAGLRAGRGSVFVASRAGVPAGQAAVDVMRDGVRACHDARALQLPDLTGVASTTRLTFALGGAHVADPEDPLRSRCPGPARSPGRDGALAIGSIDLAELGARRLSVRLAGRAVRDPDFAVTPQSALALELARTRQTVRAENGRVAG